MPDTIRIGVVGAGRNTRLLHIPNLKKIEGVKVVSVVNRSRAHPELVTQVVPASHTFPVDTMVIHLLADGYIGELQAVEVRVPTGFLDRNAPMHWRMDRDLSGLNAMSMGIWYECIIGAIRGAEEVRRTTFVDGVSYMDFTEAVHTSSREGRRVCLPLA